jgi:hypothetical protein
MKPTLYAISAELSALLNLLEENGGEITPEIEQALAISQGQLEEKAVDYGHAILNYEGMAAAAKVEKERLDNLCKFYDNTAKRLKKTIGEAMRAFEMPKIETPTMRLSISRSTATQVDDLNALPAQYKKTKEEVSADKSAIKAFILAEVKKAKEEGREIDPNTVVPGAHLVENVSLSIK